MVLYLIRHGDPDYENDCLTEKGRLQADVLAKRLWKAQPDKIFTSPAGRAIETARPACTLTGLDPVVLPWAGEICALTDYPDGKTRWNSDLPGYILRGGAHGEHIDLDYDHAFEAGGFKDTDIKRQYDELIKGFREFLSEQGFIDEGNLFRVTRRNTEKVLLFCHCVMAKSLLSYLLHIPIHLVWSGFGINCTGVTVINMHAEDNGYCAPRCLVHNDLSHLYGNGMPLTFGKDYI